MPEVTATQIKALWMVSNGATHKAVGAHLGMTVGAVGTMMKRVYDVLGARSGAHAVRIAIERGLFAEFERSRARTELAIIQGRVERLFENPWMPQPHLILQAVQPPSEAEVKLWQKSHPQDASRKIDRDTTH